MSKHGQGDLAADKKRALTLTPVSRETEKRLEAFVALLLTWQRRINLIAPSTIADVWTRHVADSLQLVALAPRPRCGWTSDRAAAFRASRSPARWRTCRAPWSIWLKAMAKRPLFCVRRCRITGVPAKVHQERAENFGETCAGNGACRDRARARPIENPVRSGVSFDRPGRRRAVPQGSRCRCRIDGSR